jgi:hypothetical protein
MTGRDYNAPLIERLRPDWGANVPQTQSLLRARHKSTQLGESTALSPGESPTGALSASEQPRSRKDDDRVSETRRMWNGLFEERFSALRYRGSNIAERPVSATPALTLEQC